MAVSIRTWVMTTLVACAPVLPASGACPGGGIGCVDDGDADGVVDAHDTCPGTPPGAAVTIRGCPHDSDGDGIADYLDRCPQHGRGERIDASGCVIGAVIALPGLSFEPGSATLRRGSQPVLERAGDTLLRYPDLRVEVAGYTDSRGAESDNLRLSRQRAEAVRRYFVRRGIDPSRLSVRGYGEADPVADNRSAAGRARNRRVVLRVLD